MPQVGSPVSCSNCCPEGPVLANCVLKVMASREAMRSGGFSTNVPCDVEGFSIADSEFEPPHAATSIADAIAPKALRNLFMPASPFRPGQKKTIPAAVPRSFPQPTPYPGNTSYPLSNHQH